MNLLKKAAAAVLLVAVGLLISGCTSKTSRDTTIPWSRPAGWEGQIPGMTAPGN